MRADGFLRNLGRGYDRLAVIMVLIAYIFVGGIAGFASSTSGHASQETVHLPSAKRDHGFSGDARFDHRPAAETATGHPSNVIRQAPDPTGGTPPPLLSKSAAAASDLAQFINLVLNYLTGARVLGPLLETQTVAAANPEWWLRTVVLHL